MAELEPPWKNAFTVETTTAKGMSHNDIWLAQFSRSEFFLHSTITYVGDETGLEKYDLNEDTRTFIRTVGPDTLGPTDLASVPGPLRWFVNSYGAHTPAALIHDRLIGNKERPAELTDQMADRYFRFMLKSVNVSWLRRWMMWAAIAIRSRWVSSVLNKAKLVLWVLLSIVGMTALVLAIVTPSWILAGVAVGLPFLAAGLWGRQYAAGLVATLAAPWLLPPTVLAAAGYLVYLVLEAITGGFTGGKLTFKLQPDAPHKAATNEQPPPSAQPAGRPVSVS